MACSSGRAGLLALAAAALLGAAPVAGIDPRVAAALEALAAKDLRVARVAFRLQTGGVRQCRNRTALPGLIVQEPAQYRADLRPAMAALYNLGPYPAVTGVVPGGPADRAGVRTGDQVTALDGVPLGATPARSRKADGDSYGLLVDRLARAFAKGRATLALRRDGAVFTRTVVGAPACASAVQLDLDTGRNAGADGSTVTISQGLLDFTRSDDELAFVIGHELAHNILGHRSFLDSTRRGGGGESGAAVIETEREADYWGLYLVAWAGYDVTQTPAFWQRIARVGWLSNLFSDGSHPGNRTRARDLQREVAEIQAARAARRPLVPDFERFEAAAY